MRDNTALSLKPTVGTCSYEEVLARGVPKCRAVITKLRCSAHDVSMWIPLSEDGWTNSVSATAGSTPSITFSCFGSLPERSQTMILPSAPHVVYGKVDITQDDMKRVLTSRVPDGCHVALRTALECPSRTVMLVMSCRSMTLTVGSLYVRQPSGSRILGRDSSIAGVV